MKIGTLLTAAIVSLVRRRRRPCRLCGRHEIPDHGQGFGGAEPAGGRAGRRRHSALHQSRARLCHQHPVRTRRRSTRRCAPELIEKYRKQTDGARDKMNAIRKDLSGRSTTAPPSAAGIDALNVEIRRPARGHRQGHRRPGRCAQGRRQEDRRRQRRVQHRGDRAARRAGPQDGAARRRRLPAGELRQHRLDAARRRRLNASLHKNLVGAKRVGDRRREDGYEPLAGPQRPDPDVAAGIARQSRDARPTWLRRSAR